MTGAIKVDTSGIYLGTDPKLHLEKIQTCRYFMKRKQYPIPGFQCYGNNSQSSTAFIRNNTIRHGLHVPLFQLLHTERVYFINTVLQNEPRVFIGQVRNTDFVVFVVFYYNNTRQFFAHNIFNRVKTDVLKAFNKDTENALNDAARWLVLLENRPYFGR